tara:strand:+ start:1778 stop:1969 length:192 start_codon:yes stop_codon:yes gene_type:complete
MKTQDIKKHLLESSIEKTIINFQGKEDLFEIDFHNNNFIVWKNGQIISSTKNTTKFIKELLNK